jgi:general secretion pathway protein H
MERRCHGFTLLELLVVLVIIGIILSVAVISIGDGGRSRQITQEGERLVALIEHAGDEAITQGVELGIHFTANDYQFITLKEGHWVPYHGKRSLRQRHLPEWSYLEMSLDMLPVPLLDAQAANQSDGLNTERLEPQLLILSSGERSPFEITLFNGESAAIQISGDLIGTLQWQRLQEQQW